MLRVARHPLAWNGSRGSVRRQPESGRIKQLRRQLNHNRRVIPKPLSRVQPDGNVILGACIIRDQQQRKNGQPNQMQSIEHGGTSDTTLPRFGL
jgi:hypothetical protein